MILNQIKVLFWLDSKALRAWFFNQLLSKLIVGFGFGLVGILVAIFIGGWSYLYMQTLFSYETYGQLTALYLLKAALLLIGFLGIGSAVMANLVLIFNPGKENNFLLTLPVVSEALVIWLNLKTLFLNWFLISLVTAPIVFVYGITFTEQMALVLILRILAVSLVLTLLVNGLGGIIAYLTAQWWRKLGQGASILGILIFFGLTTVLIFRVIFPDSLQVLYNVPIERFSEVYSSLPLISNWWPSSILAEMVFEVNKEGLLMILFSGIIFVSSLWIQAGLLTTLWQTSEIKTGTMKKFFDLEKSGGLVLKDVLSVLREPAELGYGWLLVGMAVAFFGLLIQANLTGNWTRRFETDITVASFGFLLFFATAFGLRILFPLMAREGETSWWLFTLPIRRVKIMKAKLSAGLVIGLGLILLSIVLWLLLPLGSKGIWVGMFSGMMVVLLLFLLSLWGMISPLFDQGDKPEQVSTSTSGLMVLFLGLLLIGSSSMLLSRALTGSEIGQLGMAWLLGIMIVFLLSVVLAYRSIKTYQF